MTDLQICNESQYDDHIRDNVILKLMRIVIMHT